MDSSLSSQAMRNAAAVWIGAGLAVLLLAQVIDAIPIATAMSLVAWGAVLLAMARSAGGRLAVANLAIYVLLVGFAIASQTHAAQDGSDGYVSLLLLTDHALAIVLLIGLSIQTFSHTVARLSDER